MASESVYECPLGERECPFHDEIHQLRHQVDKLQALVNTDHLTQLYNKKHFWHALAHELERTQRSLQPTTLIMMDIDHFKSFNDTYGHLVGDKVLMHLAQLIKESVRTIDIACRYGGEEFAIIILNKPSHYAESLAQLICNETSKALIPHKQSKCADVVTVSVGVATLQIDEVKDVNHLISIADKALYQAKNKGRNCVLINEENCN